MREDAGELFDRIGPVVSKAELEYLVKTLIIANKRATRVQLDTSRTFVSE